MSDFEIEWPEDYFGRRENETPDKGWLQIRVRVNGARYILSFYDLARATQTLKDARAHGPGYFTEPGLIIIDEVDTASVKRAIAELDRDGFFDSDSSWPKEVSSP